MIWSASYRAMPAILNAFEVQCDLGFEFIKARHCGIVLLAIVHRHESVWMQGPCLPYVASQLVTQQTRQQAPRSTLAVADAGHTAHRSGGARCALGQECFVQRAAAECKHQGVVGFIVQGTGMN